VTRILVYSHDTYGLGNIRRMLAIATHLAESIEDASVLIVSGSPMLQGFRIAPSIDYIKLPCVTRTARDRYATRSLGLNAEDAFDFRANLILAAVADFRPDIILVDKKPFGVENELEGAIHYAKGSLPDTRIVLVLRDVLDAPAATMQTWRAGNYTAAIDRFYDLVLVLGTRSIFDPCREYQLPQTVCSRMRFCGYVRRAPGVRSRDDIRRELALGADERLVLVTPGGGEDGARILETYAQAVSIIHGAARVHSLIVTGPELDRSERASIEHAVRESPGADVREFTNDMMSYMNAADAVVCMGGYNTICEVASVQKRAIVVPRVRPVEEQLIRADRLARRRLITLVHPDAMTPQTLGESVLQALDPDRRMPRAALDLDALPRITNYLGALQRRENLQRAPAPALVYRAPQPAPIARDADARPLS
jgi:predicted glycosyltransferase